MIPLYRPPVSAGLESALADLVRAGWWGYGPRSHALEKLFTLAHGGAAVAVGSGTAALHLAARLLRRSDADEVIVPALTYVSTAMAFYEAGFKVRIADVEASTLLINIKSVAELLSPHTRAVVPVHLYGQRVDAESLVALLRGRDIAIVEDRAHRLGLDERPAGDFACYSFNPLKEAPAGDGGLLWCRDEGTCSRARVLSNLGIGAETWERTAGGQHAGYAFTTQSGLRMRMSDVAAGFVLASISELPKWRRRRHAIFRRLADACSTPTIRLRRESADDSYLMAVCRVTQGRREQARARLSDAGIATSASHYLSLSRHPLWSSGTSCPQAESADGELITLPMFPDLGDTEVTRICEALRATAESLE